MFKAVDNSGSRGVIKVDKASDVESAYEAVRKVTKKDYCIVEEFIEGVEFGAQAFIYRGNVQFVLPHGDFVFHSDAGVPIGHYAPMADQESIQGKMWPEIQKLARKARLDTCALNIDCIARDDAIYFLEIGARVGATCLVELVSLYYNIDYYAHIVKGCLGLPIDFTPSGFTPNASKVLFSEQAGTIRSIVNTNTGHPGIVDISLQCNVGDTVRKFHTAHDRLGHVITKGKTLDEALSLLDSVIDKIKIEIS